MLVLSIDCHQQVLPLPGIMAISRILPINETQLGAIDHMSKERMKDYKAVILEVTRNYHNHKMDVLASNAALRKEEEEETDFQPSSQFGAGGGGSRGRGRGRGKSWRGGFKRKRGGSQGGGGVSKRGRGGGYGRGRGSRGGGGGGGGSMGLPVAAIPRAGYR